MADPTSAAYDKTTDRNTIGQHGNKRIVVPGHDIAVPASFDKHYPMWQTLRDCYEGETRMKAAADKYIRKLNALDTKEHETYVSRAYFYNAVRRTHAGLVGSMFRKPPEFTLPKSSKINPKKVSFDGHSLRSFSRTTAHEVLLVGRYGVLVDFKEDPKNAYMVGYKAEDIYAWRYRVQGDERIVDRVILLEKEASQTEYSETYRDIIRILCLDPNPDNPKKLIYSQTVITLSDDGTQATEKKINFNTRGRTLDYMPFVFFNPSSLGAEVEPAPMADIATINVSHFQSTAHLEHGRFYAGMPTYVTSGEEDGLLDAVEGLANTNPRRVGPNTVWELGPEGKAWILEFTGHGLTFLENAVDSKQLQMQSLGGRLISSTRRAAAMSDEAWQLLETGDEATLLDVAYQMDEGFTKLLIWMQHIRGEITEPESDSTFAEFNKEFVRSELTAREIRALQSLYERQIIPVDVMYYALREVSVIPQEYSLEDFKALMDKKEQLYEPPAPKLPPKLPANNGPPGGPGVRPPTIRNPAPAPKTGATGGE